MDLEATLQSEHESLIIRLELIEQIQSEYENDVESLKHGIGELVTKLVTNNGRRDATINPLLAQLYTTLAAAAAEDSSDDSDSDDSDEEEEEEEVNSVDSHDDNHEDNNQHIKVKQSFPPAKTSEYPKRIANEFAALVILGPNGTTISAPAFDRLLWSTYATATRSLLSLVFNEDILATHTLTGKPSPAFHGRERPSKMQLDPLKTADIIQCVMAMCPGTNERSVRASITTKCADTAKKYKRRHARNLCDFQSSQ